MSYYLIIRSDDHYTARANHAHVDRFIRQLPGMRGMLHLDSPERGIFMRVELEVHNDIRGWCNPTQLPVYDPATSEVGRVRIVIPTAFYPQALVAAHPVIVKIAAHMQWRVYDPQRDNYWAEDSAIQYCAE